MKKLISTLLIVTAFVAAPSVNAESVSCRVDGQYGGSICGVETTSETVISRKYETGLGDNQLLKVIAAIAGTAVVATVLYKLTYKNYLLG